MVAVVDAIAEALGSQVDVYGHSHGGFCALGAAGLCALASALPDARVLVLEGQGHLADVFAPESIARHLLGFLSERP